RPDGKQAVTSSVTSGMNLIDPRAILAACGDDPVILERICQTFRTSLPGQLQAVQDAFRQHEAANLREAAHKISSMVAAFSTTAGEVASRLEDLAAQGNLEQCGPLVSKLEGMAQELLRAADGLSWEALQRLTEAVGNTLP